ncbi:probable 28S ribosomal protein S16, mitochondrial [Varroa jacobsoni]|uniref:Small ribosomal subunit protein bS16m n=1 Tax=Varroa destructor TaxID=109461 RepID=A0A7M7JK04_VARDE|nr:probable 28S ribosomal protein S16, mitochondrial [Varroa destructor]XP_022653334.1 probable 28S ribosomal protein S16, mitochondrial [Varroa destructor]XP_022653335.1 probable 28S ribosomal protein S16, mitochondrial [Varroa destructor]XP_022709874.1 probable 28S ribosomal protein S16, mitochondrial [Varroa jacobsoni]XP_022709875.1 probable 28S ribosomal protein S16, mitochondrial [Varroa jacobsoni]XP_022709878.1 probable 28S ribosomal protein S16, mitochondrial [Varroa jacobsoni]
MPPVLRIMMVQKGCANRPFYHIVATHLRRRPDQPTLEQIGSFDPMPNEHNENLVSINYDRLNYWLGQGATPARGVGMLLGMAGYTMLHPYSYKRAWEVRLKNMDMKSSTTDVPTKPPEA